MCCLPLEGRTHEKLSGGQIQLHYLPHAQDRSTRRTRSIYRSSDPHCSGQCAVSELIPIMKLTRREMIQATVGAGLCLRGATKNESPIFEEIPPERSGITWVHENAMSEMHYLPETMG